MSTKTKATADQTEVWRKLALEREWSNALRVRLECLEQLHRTDERLLRLALVALEKRARMREWHAAVAALRLRLGADGERAET